jgi:two-component system sensor kinase FixL
MLVKHRSVSSLIYVFGVAVTVAIFIADTLTSLQIAVAVLYVLVVLMAAELFNKAGVILVSLLCMGLTLTAFCISHGLNLQSSAFARCVISLAAIAITTVLALKSQTAKALLQQQVYLLSQTHDAILTCAMNGVITSWNAGACRLYGWTKEQAVGNTLSDLLQTPDSAMAQLIRTGHFEGELVEQHQSGRQVIVASRWSLELDDQGKARSILISNNDLTESRLSEEKLRGLQSALEQANRLSILGQMSASLAHEINQPLASISMNAEASLRWINRPEPDLPEITSCVTAIVKEADRAAEVVKRIRTLSKKGTVTLLQLDFAEVISESVLLLEKELQRHHIQSRLLLPEQPAWVAGDKIQLQQVLINLLVNAIQAMEQTSEAERRLTVSLEASQQHWLLKVADSGVGISAVAYPLLFEAFYSTKSEGMGMGLSICRSIAEAHHGLLWAEQYPADEKPVGAVFYLQLPRLEAAL